MEPKKPNLSLDGTISKLINAIRRRELAEGQTESLARSLQVGGCSPAEFRELYGLSLAFYHKYRTHLPPSIKIGRRVIHPWRAILAWEQEMLAEQSGQGSERRA